MAGEIDPKAAQELAENVKMAGKYAEDALDAFQKQLKVITQMRDAMEEISKLMSGLSQQDNKALSPDAWKRVTKEVLKSEKASRDASKAFKEVSTSGAKLAKGLLFTGGALSGLFQGFKNLVALGRGVLGFFFSVAGGIFEVGKSILAIPFKMMSGLFKMASTGGSNELLEALENVRDSFGDLKSESSRAIIDTAKNIETMNESGVPSYLIFGNLAGRIKAVTEMAQGMGAAFQVFQGEVEENGTAMMLYQRGLGITNEQMTTIASNAMRMGTSIAKVQNEMTKQALGMSKAFGVNAKVISKDMAKAMSDLAHFGHLSTKEMAVAATFANKLGVSVDKLTAIMDQTATYDQAAEGMSKLNEQYGTNLDATEMMMAQNPADKVELLRKAFAATGKDMSKLTYQDRMFIKQQTGMSDELMNSAFAAKNAGVSLDKMRTEAEKAEKATMSQTEAIKALGDSIKRTFPSGSGGGGGVMDHFLDGFFRGIQSSKEFIGMMMNIKQVLRIATQEGVKFGREFVNLFPGVKDIFTGLKEVFDPARFRKMFDGVFKALDVFRDKGSGKIEDFVERIKSVFSDFTNGTAGEKVKEGFKKFGKAIFAIVIATGQWLSNNLKSLYRDAIREIENPGPTTIAVKNHIASAIKSLSEFIQKELTPFLVNAITSLTSWLTDGKKLRDAAPVSKIMSTMSQIFGPLGDALKDAAVKLYPVLKELTKTIVIKIKDFLIESWKEMDWKDQLGVLAVTFGPQIGNAAIGIGAAVIKNVLQKKAQEKAIQFAVEQTVKRAATSAAVGAAETAVVGATTAATTATATAVTAGAVEVGAATTAAASAGGALATAGAAVAAALASPVVIAAGTVAAITGLAYYGIRRQVVSKQVEEQHGMNNDLLKNIKEGDEDLQSKIKKLAEARQKTASDLEESRSFIGKNANEKTLEKMLKEQDDAMDGLIKQQRVKAKERRAAEAEAIKEEQRKQDLREAQEKNMRMVGSITIDNAAERFKKIEELSNKIMGKDFNLKDKLEEMRKKLSDVDFNLMGKTQEEQLLRATDQMQRIHSIFLNISEVAAYINKSQENIKGLKSDTIESNYNNLSYAITRALLAINMHDPALIELGVVRASRISDIFASSEKISADINSFLTTSSKYTGEAITSSITKTLKAVEDMVKAVQAMDNALSKVDKIDIGARLTQVAGSMGLGSSGVYKVQSKEVVLNVTFNVTMDAQELEKVMIGNKKSIIRDRINFALDKGAKSDPNTKNAYIKSTPGAITGYVGSDIPGSL